MLELKIKNIVRNLQLNYIWNEFNGILKYRNFEIPLNPFR